MLTFNPTEYSQPRLDSDEYVGRGNRHILAFMDVFASAIVSLNGGDREHFYERMVLLGARHAAIPGMKTEYFKVIGMRTLYLVTFFLVILIDCILIIKGISSL